MMWLLLATTLKFILFYSILLMIIIFVGGGDVIVWGKLVRLRQPESSTFGLANQGYFLNFPYLGHARAHDKGKLPSFTGWLTSLYRRVTFPHNLHHVDVYINSRK